MALLQPNAAPAEPEGEQFTPEEQKALDVAIEALGTLIYGRADELVGLLQGENATGKAAELVAELVMQIDEQSDGALPEAVVIPAATKGLELLVDVGVEGQAITDPDTFLAEAAQALYAILFEEYGVEESEISELEAGYGPA